MNKYRLSEQIKIMYIIGGLNTGGAEVSLLRLVKGLDLKKFTPYVVTMTDEGELGAELASSGIPLIKLGLNNWWSAPYIFLKLMIQIHKIKPDIVHTWLYHADIFGGLAAKVLKVPVIIWGVRCSNFLNSTTTLSTKLALYLCIQLSSWLPHLVIYNSKKGLFFHKEIGYKETNSLVIPNGINLDQFEPNSQFRNEVRNKLGIKIDTPLIGLIGRYDLLKNHLGFIVAAKLLHATNPEVHFLLAGDQVDIYNETLKLQIGNAGLIDNFHLLGLQSDIYKTIAALDLLSLTSTSEGFPNVLIEAMACAVPCISTNAGDAEAIIGNKNYIVPIGDMAQLAKKWDCFLNLTKSQRLTIGNEARQRVIDKFEIGKVIRYYETAYVNLVINYAKQRNFI